MRWVRVCAKASRNRGGLRGGEVSRLTHLEEQQLRADFVRAMTHFKCGKDTQRVAWESAMADARKAIRCYGAIARSLPR